jgi:pimeloyl-ACP methyl ester carboxylesterase
MTPTTVMGHSWGGRSIALQYVHSLLENSNDTSLPSLWLLDTVPGQAHDTVLQVLDAVQRIDLVNKTRHDVVQELVNSGLDSAISQWLASTLQQDPTTKLLKWGFDVELVQEIMPEFQSQDFVGMLNDIVNEGDGEVHLVKGGLNAAWEESSRVLLQLNELSQQYPNQFQQHTLPNAGHWVHVDDLPGLLNIVQEKVIAKKK